MDMEETCKEQLGTYRKSFFTHSTQLNLFLNSFNRVLCERLAKSLALQFEKREAVLRGQNGQKLAVKRLVKANKKFKRLRDKSETTKGIR